MLILYRHAKKIILFVKKIFFFLHLLNTILKFAIILINFNQNNIEYEKDF